MTQAHSPYGFSRAETMVKCPGSVMLQAIYPPSNNSIPAMEGTAAHWVWLQMLQNLPVHVGSIAPNSIPVTDEMMDGGELFIETIDEYVPRSSVMAEQTLVCASIDPENWGTPDVYAISPEKKIIDNFEYKFGHRYVDPFENWQMVNQSCAIAEMLGLDGFQEQEWIVRSHVIQPRSYTIDGPVRKWETYVALLRRQKNILKSAIELAKRPNAACFSGPHCQDCSARANCQTCQRTAMTGLNIALENIPAELTPEMAGAFLQKLQHYIPIMKAAESGLEEQVKTHIVNGKLVHGFKLEPHQGRLNWSLPEPEIVAMAASMGIDIKRDKCDTPKQAIKKGFPEAVVKQFASSEHKGMKLVPDDGTGARKAFFKLDKVS